MQLASPVPAPLGQSLASAHAGARPRHYEIFEVPEAVPIPERAIEMNGIRYAILEIWLALLTTEEEKKVAGRAGMHAGNAMILASLRATEAMRILKVAPVETALDAAGKPEETINLAAAVEFEVSTINATAEGAYAAMHPGMRDLVIMAYGVSSSIEEGQAALFLKSRRAATR
jgi:hypothetical protein